MGKGIISNMLSKQNEIARQAIEEIKNAYKEDNRPWIVGYSGGKDSTVVVQLIFDALSELPRNELHKKVYVISSDTLVETPLIINSINQTLRRIQDEALKLGLPIETHKVKPRMEQSFWVNLIGRGYPSPNQQFRWCTDRLKIDPANQFVKDKVSDFGEVIMVLGVREDESISRGNSMRSHTITGKLFMKHTTLPNAYVYAPIRHLGVDDVWDYLLNYPSPWGDDNYELYNLYQDSNSGECPLVIDKATKDQAGSCGNSRFGCWVCTVVTEDKALNGFIHSGQDWLKPLLDFRNWLADIRDDRTRRMKYRMRGQVYFNEVKVEEDSDGTKYMIVPRKGSRRRDLINLEQERYDIIERDKLNSYLTQHNIDLSAAGDQKLLVTYKEEGLDGEEVLKYAQLGLGPYTFEARKEILRNLLQAQRVVEHPDDPHFELIRKDELIEIRKAWLKNGDWEDSLPSIYSDVVGHEEDWDVVEKPVFEKYQISDLEFLCEEFNVDINVIKQLISIEKEYSGLKVRRGLMDEIRKTLTQDYLHL